MGLTANIASTRINRYEVGTSEPDLRTSERMAKMLGVRLSWLVCTDPKLATVIERFSKLDAKKQDAFVARLQAESRKLAAKKGTAKVAGAKNPSPANALPQTTAAKKVASVPTKIRESAAKPGAARQSR